MAIEYALDFFKTPEECEIEALRKAVDEMDKSVHRIRKALFARHGTLQKQYDELKHEFETLKQVICKNG